VAVAGPSGCGKRTSCRCSERWMTSEGEILFHGRRSGKYGTRSVPARTIGFVFQSFIYCHALALDNVQIRC